MHVILSVCMCLFSATSDMARGPSQEPSAGGLGLGVRRLRGTLGLGRAGVGFFRTFPHPSPNPDLMLWMLFSFRLGALDALLASGQAWVGLSLGCSSSDAHRQLDCSSSDAHRRLACSSSDARRLACSSSGAHRRLDCSSCDARRLVCSSSDARFASVLLLVCGHLAASLCPKPILLQNQNLQLGLWHILSSAGVSDNSNAHFAGVLLLVCGHLAASLCPKPILLQNQNLQLGLWHVLSSNAYLVFVLSTTVQAEFSFCSSRLCRGAALSRQDGSLELQCHWPSDSNMTSIQGQSL